MDIKGGVTPLKLKASKAKSRRGGKAARSATTTAKQRGGFKRASGKQGVGINRGGYNVQTRWVPREDPYKGGKSSSPTVPGPTKPYSIDDKGDIDINIENIIGGTEPSKSESKSESTSTIDLPGWEWVPGTEDRTETETWKSGGSNVESYKQVWSRKGKKYKTSGQSSRMSDDYYDKIKDKLTKGSVQKGGYTIHPSIEAYAAAVVQVTLIFSPAPLGLGNCKV